MSEREYVLHDLADRVMNLPGRDPVMNLAIAQALGGVPADAYIPAGKTCAYVAGSDEGIFVLDRTGRLASAIYTVPPGHDWVLYSDGVAGCEPTSEEGCTGTCAQAATPTLAILSAALRARATAQEQGR